ncbi:MAG: hypothetical protein GF364_07690, partial [Candidatus Lokiarchaeota archaeon]|nr:hypothetical protein [Candidatus Lokiarchaeota archaeon]
MPRKEKKMQPSKLAINKMSDSQKLSLIKWRLILGKKAEDENISYSNFSQKDLNQLVNAHLAGTFGPTNSPKKKKKKSRGKRRSGSGNIKDKLSKIDSSIDFVYNPKQRETKGAGNEGTKISIPIWLRQVKELFPKKAKEVLERDLVKKRKTKIYHI